MAGTRIASAAVTAALVLAALVGFAASAAAKPGYHLRERSLRSQIFLESSRGYQISIKTKGHKQVELTTFDGIARSVAYKTTGRVSSSRIDADFGELGRVSVRFDGKRVRGGGGIRQELDELFGGCRGRDPIRWRGQFRGSIAFEGENGYTSVDISSAPGIVEREFRRVCKGPEFILDRGGEKASTSSEPLGGGRVTMLTAREETIGRRVTFTSLILPPGLLGDFGVFSATVNERREGMRIARSAFEFVEGSSLLISPAGKAPIQATVAPVPPFQGGAEYLDAAGVPPVWSGSLGVRLPGAGLVPLTGEGFSAALCRVPLLEFSEEHPCLRRAGLAEGEAEEGSPIVARAQQLLRRAQISGSQSWNLEPARLSWSR